MISCGSSIDLLLRDERGDDDEQRDAADAEHDRPAAPGLRSSSSVTRALTIAVMTSATAPSGWTTMSGAKPRLVSWKTIARPSMTRADHPRRPGEQPHELPDAEARLAPEPWRCFDELDARGAGTAHRARGRPRRSARSGCRRLRGCHRWRCWSSSSSSPIHPDESTGATRRYPEPNGRSTHPHHRRPRSALPRRAGRPRSTTRVRDARARHRRDDGRRARRRPRRHRRSAFRCGSSSTRWVDDDGVRTRGIAINPELSITPLADRRPRRRRRSRRAACRSPASGSRCGAPTRRCSRATGPRRRARTRCEATGWLARIFQHEFDHLDGVLYADRLDASARPRPSRRRSASRAGASPGQSWMPGVDDLDA